jgi:hypothetical protein
MLDLHFITEQERQAIERQMQMASGDPKDFFVPGLAWYCPWYNNQLNIRRCKERKEKGLNGNSFISVEYWRDWAETRPPIMVVCPGGYHWLIDGKSPDGAGWTITGEIPCLSANKPVKITGFSGWLMEGKLTEGAREAS